MCKDNRKKFVLMFCVLTDIVAFCIKLLLCCCVCHIVVTRDVSKKTVIESSYLFIYLSIYLSIYRSVCLSIYLHVVARIYVQS